MDTLPVILLTGYLGAGKTTLLNALLASPGIRDSRPALVINEFGDTGVDGKLLRPGDYAKFEINKGSLFCTCTQTQFVLTLNHIANELRSGAVLIESTGIAETRNIEGALAIPALTRAFHLRANLCVVDALNFTKVAPFLKIAQDQVRWADGIIINKTDLVGEAALSQLQAALRGLNPHAPQAAASFGRLPDGFLDDVRHVARDGALAEAPPEDIVALSVELDASFDRDRFMAVLKELGADLLRLKGNVDFGPHGRRFVEVVYDRLTEGEPCEGFASATAFTAIAWRITRDDLAARFDKARISA